MRKLINYGAGILAVSLGLLVVLCIVETVVLVVRGSNAFDNPTVASFIPMALLISVALLLGYYFLMKKLGTWNEAAWYTMSRGRKTVLFLLALPGIIEGIGPIILLAIVWVFMAVADADQARKPLPWE